MKKTIVLFILTAIMFACGTPKSDATKNAEIDAAVAKEAVTLFSVFSENEAKKELVKKYGVEATERYFKSLKSISETVDKEIANMTWDTVGVSTGPVKIISAKAADNSNEYITDKNIKISYKNVSDKKIVGIRIKWYVTNAFGEPVKDMGGNYDGFGVGLDDSPLGAGKTASGTWDSNSGFTKNVKAWPIEVAFEDGSKWKSSFK